MQNDDDSLPSVLDVDGTPPESPVRPRRLPALRPLPDPAPVREADLPEPESAQALVRVVQSALAVQFQRIEQMAKMLEAQYQQSQAVTSEMLDTLRLVQDWWAQRDAQESEMIDKLARITAALIKLYQLDLESQNNSIF